MVFKHLNSNELTLLENEQEVLSVQFDGFPLFGYLDKTKCPFLCIEPWCGLADNVNHNGELSVKEGINLLEKDAIFNRTMIIRL